jgi:hypothetical protein
MSGRTDGAGAAFAGSQLQTQLYVNRRSRELEAAIRDEFAELDHARFEWRSPLVDDRYREYWDDQFLRRLGFEDAAAALTWFWPMGGPHWDALALVKRRQERPGILLVEGKSYPAELYGTGSAAKSTRSIELIERSLEWAQREVGVEGRTPKEWSGRLYQDANRLAHLYWLNELQDIDTWLVHLLFTEDTSTQSTSAESWEEAIAATSAELGIAGLEIPRAGHVILPAGSYEDLTSRTAES